MENDLDLTKEEIRKHTVEFFRKIDRFGSKLYVLTEDELHELRSLAELVMMTTLSYDEHFAAYYHKQEITNELISRKRN